MISPSAAFYINTYTIKFLPITLSLFIKHLEGMAHNKNSRDSQGLCQKIRNAVGPFRSMIYRQPSISVISRPQNNEDSASPQTKPAPLHVLHQSSALSKMIPVEFNHISAQNTEKIQSAGQEIVIVRGQKFGKSASRKKEGEGKPTNHGQFVKARSKKDDDPIHEGRFSEYISKVKNRMMKTASNVGGVDKTLSLK